MMADQNGPQTANIEGINKNYQGIVLGLILRTKPNQEFAAPPPPPLKEKNNIGFPLFIIIWHIE